MAQTFYGPASPNGANDGDRWTNQTTGETRTFHNGTWHADGFTSSSPARGVGYGTGAGGAVTQATNRVTGVTLNNVCGQITTNNASLAAGATARFTVTDSAVNATDVVHVAIASGTTTDQTDVKVQAVAAGSFDIVVANRHASTAETGAIVINFAVVRSVAS